MTPTKVQRLLHRQTKFSESDLDQRARRLRDSRMLPVGARGPAAPDVEPGHVANLLMAMGAEKAVDAVESVLRYAPLVPVGATRDFLGNETFGDTLEELLGDPEWKFGVDAVILCRSWPEAVIVRRRDGNTLRHEYRHADAPATGYGSGARVDLTLRGGVLSYLALVIADIGPPEGGWGTPPHLADRSEGDE